MDTTTTRTRTDRRNGVVSRRQPRPLPRRQRDRRAAIRAAILEG